MEPISYELGFKALPIAYAGFGCAGGSWACLLGACEGSGLGPLPWLTSLLSPFVELGSRLACCALPGTGPYDRQMLQGEPCRQGCHTQTQYENREVRQC